MPAVRRGVAGTVRHNTGKARHDARLVEAHHVSEGFWRLAGPRHKSPIEGIRIFKTEQKGDLITGKRGIEKIVASQRFATSVNKGAIILSLLLQPALQGAFAHSQTLRRIVDRGVVARQKLQQDCMNTFSR